MFSIDNFIMVFTYLLKSSKDEGYYTGISHDPVGRLKVHNAGKVWATKNRRPLALWYQKQHNSYAEARKHEKCLKKKNHEYKDKLAE